MLLLHLELGDAVAQQPADLVVALVDGDGVAGPGELLGGGQARPGPEPTTATVRPESHSGGLRPHAARLPGPVDDRDLDVLDGHRVAG